MIDYMDLVLDGYVLLAQSKQKTIPYVNGGMTLSGMDCQGLCEYLLIQCGMSKSVVNLRGSNAHWRNQVKWQGTPEECVALFGKVPDGAWLYIHEPREHKDYRDGKGDLVHMGQYLDYDIAIHASASRGQVAESAFKGKTIRGGGWNRVMLSNWVQYAPEVEAKLGNVVEMPEGDVTVPEIAPKPPAPAPVQSKYAIVYAENGKPVKARKTADKSDGNYREVAVGTRVEIKRDLGNGWTEIRLLNSVEKWHMMTEFLRMED